MSVDFVRESEVSNTGCNDLG